MEIVGNSCGTPKPIFSLSSMSVTTVQGSISVPVPAVVGIAIIGRTSWVIGLPLPEPPKI